MRRLGNRLLHIAPLHDGLRKQVAVGMKARRILGQCRLRRQQSGQFLVLHANQLQRLSSCLLSWSRPAPPMRRQRSASLRLRQSSPASREQCAPAGARPGTSFAVRTDDHARAATALAEMSIFFTSARGYFDRSTAPCNIPSTCMSSTNSPVPSSFSVASSRIVRVPILAPSSSVSAASAHREALLQPARSRVRFSRSLCSGKDCSGSRPSLQQASGRGL